MFNPKNLPTRYVVRVSSAKMPTRCWGRYQHVAVLELTEDVEGLPPIRSTKNVRIVRTWTRRYVGTTERCAARIALSEAKRLAMTKTAQKLWEELHK